MPLLMLISMHIHTVYAHHICSLEGVVLEEQLALVHHNVGLGLALVGGGGDAGADL